VSLRVESNVGPEPVPQAAERRSALHALDTCLHEMEDANERGELTVSARLVSRLRRRLGWLHAGMPLAGAIERVFAEQERYLRRAGPYGVVYPEDEEEEALPLRPGWREADPAEPMGAPEARELTDRIRRGTQLVCMLLLQAHERRAWLALGYGSWERYVAEEFGLSKSRSYELLDQGHVLRTIQAAVGMSRPPNVSAYAAGEIKPVLAEVIEEIQLRAGADDPHERVVGIVADVVRTKRKQIAAVREYAGPPARSRLRALPPESVRALSDAVALLASLPPPSVMVRDLSGSDPGELAGLERAVRWLNDFASQYGGR
jgi:hypothetical protein